MTSPQPFYPITITLTYGDQNDHSPIEFLERLIRDRSIFVRRVRQLIGNFSYLASTELHKSGYPHLHIIALSRKPIAHHRVAKYVDPRIRDLLKSYWPHGFCDVRMSGHKGTNAGSAIAYATKYLTKTASVKRLWARILDDGTYQPTQDISIGLASSTGLHVRNNDLWIQWEICRCPNTHLADCPSPVPRKLKKITWTRTFITDVRSTRLTTLETKKT